MGRWLKLQAAVLVTFLLLLLEKDELVTSGKAATNANWKNGKGEALKPGTTSEVLIPSGKEVKVEAEAKCRSWICEGTQTGASQLSIGDATAPTETGWVGIAFKLTAGATYSATGAMVFKSTSATRLSILSAGKTLATESTFQFETAGKWELAEDLTFSASTLTFGLVNKSKADVKLGGHKLTAAVVSVGEECTLDATSATVVAAKWTMSSTAVPTLTGSTIEVTGTSASFASGGFATYATVNLANPGVVTVSESFTCSTLGLLNKNVASAAIKLTKGMTVTVTGSLTSNGTAEKPNRLETTEAGKTAKLVLPEGGLEVTGVFSLIKDIDASGGGALYAPHATTIEGCTNVLKEAKPESGPAALGMMV